MRIHFDNLNPILNKTEIRLVNIGLLCEKIWPKPSIEFTTFEILANRAAKVPNSTVLIVKLCTINGVYFLNNLNNIMISFISFTKFIVFLDAAIDIKSIPSFSILSEN